MEHARSLLKTKQELAAHLTHNHQTCYREAALLQWGPRLRPLLSVRVKIPQSLGKEYREVPQWTPAVKLSMEIVGFFKV